MLVFIVQKRNFYGRISNKCIEAEVNNQNYLINFIIVTIGAIFIYLKYTCKLHNIAQTHYTEYFDTINNIINF
jgi:hypothetical protein